MYGVPLAIYVLFFEKHKREKREFKKMWERMEDEERVRGVMRD